MVYYNKSIRIPVGLDRYRDLNYFILDINVRILVSDLLYRLILTDVVFTGRSTSPNCAFKSLRFHTAFERYV
jgi:hypothetical protein